MAQVEICDGVLVLQLSREELLRPPSVARKVLLRSASAELVAVYAHSVHPTVALLRLPRSALLFFLLLRPLLETGLRIGQWLLVADDPHHVLEAAIPESANSYFSKGLPEKVFQMFLQYSLVVMFLLLR